MDDATYLETLRRELPRRVRALWQEDADYYGVTETVTEFRPVSITTDTADDGVPDLVVVSEMRHGGHRHDDDVSRHRFDQEWRAGVGVGVAAYVDWVARRIHHGVTRWPEPDPALLAAASRDLPPADALWSQMVEATHGTVEAPDRVRIGSVGVALAPEEWRTHVVRCEVDARRDRGPDALRPGDGPRSAIDELDGLLPGGWDGAGPWSGYVVWWRDELHPSSRPELPPL